MSELAKEKTWYLCKRCAFSFGSLFVQENRCEHCGGELFTMPFDQYAHEIYPEERPLYKTGVITNTLKTIDDLPKFEGILDKHNIPHEFDYNEVLRMIQEQDRMCANIEELDRKEQKRKRANGILPGMNISCPYCKSSNVRKINFTERMIDLGGKKLGKQWHCMSCGSDF